MSAHVVVPVDRPADARPAFNRDAAALARAKRSRQAFQARLAERFGNLLRGSGHEPSDSDLRMFALLASEEHQLEQRLVGTSSKVAQEATNDGSVRRMTKEYR